MGRPRFQAGVVSQTPWINIKGEIEHEYDEDGNHRLCHNGRVGDWVTYADVAVLKIGELKFGASTDFHFHLPDVFEIRPIMEKDHQIRGAV